MFQHRQKIYVVCNTGAMGDTIATFPILRILNNLGQIEKMFVSDRYWDLHTLFFPEDRMLRLDTVLKHVPADKVGSEVPANARMPDGSAYQIEYEAIPGIPMITTHNPNNLSPLHASLVDAFSSVISNCILRDNEKGYPKVDEWRLPKLPEALQFCKRFAVLALGHTTEHRMFLPEAVEAICQLLKCQGITPVLLGNTQHNLHINEFATTVTPSFAEYNLDHLEAINLIDKTTMLEALKIVTQAAVVIGMDGGLIHLAGLTDTPIVCGYTTVDPYYRMIRRHDVWNWRLHPVETESNCRYCQTSSFCCWNVSFHICQTKTRECVYGIRTQQWIEAIRDAIDLKPIASVKKGWFK